MYRWSKAKILRLKLISLLLRDKSSSYMANVLANSNDLNEYSDVKNEDFLVLNEFDADTFDKAYKLAFENSHLINGDLYSYILNIFIHIEDFSVFDDEVLEPYPINDEELVDIGLDIFESLGNKRFLDLYKRLTCKKNGLLNIQRDKEVLNGSFSYTSGINFINSYSKDNFVGIYRKYTLEDLEVLIHESMHYIIYYITQNNGKFMDFFMELEGNFGSIYAIKYIEKNINAKDGLKLRKSMIDDIIGTSYRLMVNNILFSTSENKQYSIDKARDEINKLLYNNVKLTQDNIMEYLTIDVYKEISNIASYLAVLIMTNNYDIDTILSKIITIRELEELNIESLSNLTGNGIDIIGDEYKTLKKEYFDTHKI